MPSSIDTNDSKCEQPNGYASTTVTKKCVDFVRHLPWEIVKCYIAPRLFGEGRPIVRLHQPCSLLDVSSIWAKRIISADDSIHFILSVDHTSLSNHHRMRLRMMAPFIKSLALPASGAQHIPQFLECGRCLSLTKLNIYVNGTQEALLKLLESTANLTHLDIKYRDNKQTPLSLLDVLDRCHHLIRLDFILYRHAIIDMTHSSQSDRIYGNITHLRAICEDPDSRDVFMPLIQRLPNLRLLALIYPPSSTGMNTIHQHCPHLQQLFLSYPYVPYEIHADIKKQHDDPGLRLLSIDGGFHKGDYLAEMMMRHKATLESLVLMNGPFLIITRVETLLGHHNVEFNQLKSLRFPDDSQHSFLGFIEWVVQHAPNLESVEFVDSKAWPHLLNGILRYRPLKRIALYCAFYHQPEEYQFIQHHIQLGAQSNLQSLHLSFRFISRRDSWIFLIPKLTQLKTLELSFANDIVLLSLDTFIQRVSEGCIGLEKVILKSTFFPSSSQWIHDLSKHRNLQEMIIDTTHMPDHLMIALEAFSHLKLLHLKYDIKEWDPPVKLKNRIPSLVYTEKYYPIL